MSDKQISTETFRTLTNKTQQQQQPSYFTRGGSSDSTTSSMPVTPQIFHSIVPKTASGYESDSSEEGRKPITHPLLGLRVINPDEQNSNIQTDSGKIQEHVASVSVLDDTPSETEWKVYQQGSTIAGNSLINSVNPSESQLARRESKTASEPNELPNEFASPTSPNFANTQKPPFVNLTSTNSKYNKVSYHLTNEPNAIKKYRDMAEKTKDTKTQLMFAKYLLESANTFHHQQGVVGSMWGLGSTTKKSTRPEPFLIVPQPASSAYSSTSSNTKRSEQQSLFNITMKQQASLTTSTTSNESSDQKRRMLEQEGVKWIVRLSKQNIPEACYMQASWMEKESYGFKKNKSKSIALHKIAADSNIPESIFAVASHFEQEKGLEDSKIVKLYQTASDFGYVNAIYKLAFLTIHGSLGLRQSLTEGLKLMHKACTLSSEEFNVPPYTFALILTNEYEQVDFPLPLLEPFGGQDAAILYYERAARLNNDQAQAKLGSIYEHGLYGESMNFARAFDYYEQAALNGNSKAMLGLCRLNNRGSHGPGDLLEANRLENDVSGWLIATPVNEDLAFSWCEKAAKAGNTDALSLLGWFYEIGFGVPRDFARAETYYQMAADKGDYGAKTRLMDTNKSITKQQHEGITKSSSVKKVKKVNEKHNSCKCM